MMRSFANQIRLQAEMQAGRRVLSKLAIVKSYDPGAYAAKVSLQPEDTLTGWLPVATMQAGNGSGIYAPPSSGDQVKVTFIEGDIESGVVECAFFNDEDRPLSVPSGEIWLVSKGGAKVELLATNALRIEATNIRSIGTWVHEGDFRFDGSGGVDGALSVGAGASGTFTTSTGLTVTVQDGIVTNIY